MAQGFFKSLQSRDIENSFKKLSQIGTSEVNGWKYGKFHNFHHTQDKGFFKKKKCKKKGMFYFIMRNGWAGGKLEVFLLS